MILKNRLVIFISILFYSLPSVAQYNNLEFIENKGQWSDKVKFMGDMNGGAFFLRKTGYTVLQHNASDMRRMGETMHHYGTGDLPSNTDIKALKISPDVETGGGGNTTNQAITVRSHAYEMDFANANENAKVIGDKAINTVNNYFIGNDSTKWAANCKLYQGVTYENIYPGIDAKYFTLDGLLKYEFIVKPGADPSKIIMKFTGTNGLKVQNNQLTIKTSVGDVTELSPYTYQYIGHERKVVDCHYFLKGNEVSFRIKNYDPTATLIIDPSLVFATFTGSKSDNWGFSATYGSGGTFFAGGIVFGNGFPTSPGAFQQTYQSGNSDQSFNMGIIKFSADGRQRVWATYIGGDGADQPHSLFADAQDNLVIAGRTKSGSNSYPLKPANNIYGKAEGWDIVVTKLNASGAALIGSVRIGGAKSDGVNVIDSRSTGPTELINFYGDDGRSEVILDKSGNIYLASSTQSADFFTTANAQDKILDGTQDAVLVKINANCDNVLYSSYFGGKGYDAGFVLTLDPSTQNIYMAGGTTSDDLATTPGVMQPAYGGGRSDGYVAAFSNDGATKILTTYLGTPGTDVVYGIQFDKFNFPYVMGISTGNWQMLNATYGQNGSKQFVGKLKEDLSGWVFRTHFGTVDPNPNISPVAFLVDRCQNMYISGWGKDINGGLFPMAGVSGMPISSDALKSTSPDNEDLYFIVIKRDATALLYGTMFGQDGPFGEHVDGGTSRFDQNGVIYQAICANCYAGGGTRPRWPITPGAWCCSNGWSGAAGTGSRAECNLAALKISFNFAGVGAGVEAFINGVYDTSGCVPLDIKFEDTVRNAQSYVWNFGDGSPDYPTDSAIVVHTYKAIGTYKVMLVAVDSASCNIRDTAYKSVIVRNDEVFLDFDAVKLPPCESLSYRFDNLSTKSPTAKPFNSNTFIWDFGDGTRISAGAGSVTHAYANTGTYKVRLIIPDTTYCNSPDSIEKELRISPLVKAQFETPPSGCSPYTANFTNTSLAGQAFFWDFGDGATSTQTSPTHFYASPGVYTVKLKAVDSSTCNIADSTSTTVSVSAQPIAAFTFSPIVPQENSAITFSNTSSFDATKFVWKFGDGDTLFTTSRLPFDHQYLTTGKFNACLEVSTTIGCKDTVCQEVQTIIVPKVDVPNTFTPTQNNSSSIIFVRGFGIGKMKFMIFNRFGQKVFESNDPAYGWDGRFKGTMQPMDVYAYVLDVEFTDGTKTTKKGDITLLR